MSIAGSGVIGSSNE